MSKGIQKSSFGCLPDGTEIDLYTLANANGLSCKIITYGGIITEIQAPDRDGKFANIVLGYDRLEDYVAGKDYRGAIIGRVANRIAKASFSLDGKTYALAANDGPNHLHGGLCGFDKRVWRVEPTLDRDPGGLFLHYTSPAHEEGYPGTLTVGVNYELTEANELYLNYFAVADQPTPVNLTSHPYWNLAGKGDILRHELTVAADHYTPMDNEHLPTGKIDSVGQSPFDFRSPRPIGGRLRPEYNANYVLGSGDKNAWIFAARAREPDSGRALEVWTDQPALQFYSGTFLNQPHTGFCLETQNFPDAVHHGNFPSIILPAGEVYRHRTICRFSAA
jgi:aldose 1-epimerase